MNAYALPGLDQWKSAPYDDADDLPEPTLGDMQEALDRLINDGELLTKYVTEDCYNPVTLLQLVYAGLPRPDDKSASADARRDAYSAAKDAFFSAYRDWLGTRLDDMAQTVAQERVDQDRWENRYVR